MTVNAITNDSPYGAGRKLIEYPKISERSRTPRYGVRKLDRPRFHLPLLVTGNGRSGTTWLAKTFEKAGIDCPHEHCGQHGSVSWYFAADSDWHPYHVSHRPQGRVIHVGERLSDFRFDYKVQLIRNPLKVIGSMSRVMSMTDHYYAVDNLLCSEQMFNDVGSSRLLKTMHMAYGIWTKVLGECDMTVRLEDVPKKWPQLMTMLGQDRKLPMPVVKPTNKSSGIYKANVVTYAMMEREDKSLAKHIARIATRFDYN